MDLFHLLNPRLEGLTRAERGEGFTGYEQWRVPFPTTCLEASLFRNFRLTYEPRFPTPLVIECGQPASTERQTVEERRRKWDLLALSVDRMWRGEWGDAQAPEQPGLVLLREDGAVVLSETPERLRPALAALVCFPLLTADELTLCTRESDVPTLDSVTRSKGLALLSRQGLLREAPDAFTEIYRKIHFRSSGRPPGRQPRVYLSMPGCALALKDMPTAPWNDAPESAIAARTRDFTRQFSRWKALSDRLRRAGVRAV